MRIHASATSKNNGTICQSFPKLAYASWILFLITFLQRQYQIHTGLIKFIFIFFQAVLVDLIRQQLFITKVFRFRKHFYRTKLL